MTTFGISSTKHTVAVVTGSNRGIGYELVRTLAQNGLTVVLTSRDPIKGHIARHALNTEGLKSVVYHELDVTSKSSIEKLAKWLDSEFGRIDILVNNAAIAGFNELSFEAATDMLETNYYGAKHLTEALLPLLKESLDGPRIVNVTSRAGCYEILPGESLKEKFRNEETYTAEFVDMMASKYLHDVKEGRAEEEGWISSYSDLPMYAESKIFLGAWAIVLAKTLATSQHRRITVVNVSPGPTATDMLDSALHNGIVFPPGFQFNTVAQGADTISWLALLPEADLLDMNGKFFGKRTEYKFGNRAGVPLQSNADPASHAKQS